MATSIQQGPTPDATSTTRGLVSAGTQTFGGAKTATNFTGSDSATAFYASAAGKFISSSTFNAQARAADGASAVAYIFDNNVTLSTSGASLASFRNNGTEVLNIDKDGGIYLPLGGIGIRNNVGGGTGVWIQAGTGGSQYFGVGQSGGAQYVHFTSVPISLSGSSLVSDSRVTVASLGVGNSASASVIPVANLVKKIEVFDASGTSLGFVPVYSSIT